MACVVVIVLAVAIPVGIHNSKIDTQPVETESTSSTEYDITLTTAPQVELTTEENTENPTEAPTEAPTQASATTKSVTKASTTKSVTKPAATKPATTKTQNSNNSEYQKMIDAGVPESLAKKAHSTASVVIGNWKDDEYQINSSDPRICPYCGKISACGTHGTCLRYPQDHTCPNCGTFIPGSTCHTCVY